MNNEATFYPNKLHPFEIAGLALTDPKLKLSSRVRRALMRQREQYYVSTRVPKPEAHRIIDWLAGRTMVGLIRFVKRSARRAATAKYASEKTIGPFSAAAAQEQTRQIALFRAGARMIQTRVNPPKSNEV